MQLTPPKIVFLGLQGKSIQPVTLLKVRVKSAYEPSGQSGQYLSPVSVE